MSATTTATPWREVRNAVTAPRLAADLGLRRAKERGKHACVKCSSSDGLHVYADGAKCYSCGWRGTVIDLAALVWQVEPADACRRLADSYNIQADPWTPAPVPRPVQERQGPADDILRRRAEVYGDLVARGSLGPAGRRYLEGRGLSPELADAHGIRSMETPEAWTTLWGTLEDTHGADAMTAAGLHRDGAPWFPWWGQVSALLLPYLDRNGTQVEAIRWRRITPGGRRYMAPLGAGARIPWRCEAVDGPDPLHLVVSEGEMDALALVQAGYNALALGGATPSGDVLDWLVGAVGHVSSLVLWTDDDTAGDGAAGRLVQLLHQKYGAAWVHHRVTRWRAASDPADTLAGAVV